ncbi:TonB-dependent receptor [Sphingomonas sp. AOB5]|uniref:TonB-dependent receptor n=1 Tax=Sphingomonas sp. AOB5 TaxID=3034017 RepID=UPI0023F900EF|nr:TonB-dependent receptor [Sphingomonas sp. AOB5]MDF7775553.1 TonB-dependent receptor [Sphingomonas sp. AOB5]
MKKSVLYFGCLATGLTAPAMAWAQDAAPVAVQASDEVSEDNVIVVTARKRDESLQDVPIAVTALGTDALERQQIGGLLDVGPAVPSLIVAANQGSSNGATVFIRGIGQDNSNALNEPGVGIYLDGVYLGRSIGSLVDMNNFERVEVLRGPQGTLYGRNTPGGAVKLVTKRPTFDGVHFNGDLTLGSFNRLDFRGSVNVPLSDEFAVTFSALNLTNDGYYTHAVSGEHLGRKSTTAARATALWKVSDSFTLFATADYAKDRSGLQSGTPFNITNPANPVPLYGSLYKAAPDMADINRYDGGGASLTAEWDLGAGTLSSITAYRALTFKSAYDFGSSPIGNDLFTDLKTNQFSQELQFVSALDGPFNFVGGLFYFREHSDSIPHFLITPSTTTPTTPPPITKTDLAYISIQTTDSYSAYGEAYFTPFDPLTITLGGRYTYDSKKIERGGAATVASGDVNFDNFSPKVNVAYKVSPRLNVYATWSKGYKAGAFQPYPTAATALAAIPPEIVTAWELGFKSELFDRLLTVNIAAYQNEYNDLQLNLSSTTGGSIVVNSADLRTRGIETEFTFTPFQGFSLFGAFTVSDSKFKRVPAGGGVPLLTDRQKNLPDYQLRLSPTYEVEMGNGDRIDLGVVFTATGKDQKILPNDPFHLQPAYQTVDARIAYRRPGDGWMVELAGRNLTDTTYFNTSTLLGTTRSAVRWYAPGATWSVKFGLNF